MENTVLYGNGINRLNEENPSWGKLLDGIKGIRTFDNGDLPYTMIYERILMEKPRGKAQSIFNDETRIKEMVAKVLSKTQNHEHYIKLFELKCSNYLTTNYDYAFKNTFDQINKYSFIEESTEDIYSIRRAIRINENEETQKTIWHIHGELNRPKSIMLGLDHYCGSIGKIDNYIKGKYEYQRNGKIIRLKSIKEKLLENDFDGVSWIELFFTTNVHIIGFGIDYSELDLWWILTKRARMMRDPDLKRLIKNRIVVHVPNFDEHKKGVLNSLNVKVESTYTKGDPRSNSYWRNHFDELFQHLRKNVTYSKFQEIDLFPMDFINSANKEW